MLKPKWCRSLSHVTIDMPGGSLSSFLLTTEKDQIMQLHKLYRWLIIHLIGAMPAGSPHSFRTVIPFGRKWICSLWETCSSKETEALLETGPLRTLHSLSYIKHPAWVYVKNLWLKRPALSQTIGKISGSYPERTRIMNSLFKLSRF